MFQYNLHSIAAAANFVLNKLQHHKVLCFIAPMGAGKTTLIKEICKQLQVTDVVSSPTFSIINTYATSTGQPVYHLDLYRIKDEEELLQAGVEEVLYSGHYCLVEWPQIAEFVMPRNYVTVSIEIVGEDERELKIR